MRSEEEEEEVRPLSEDMRHFSNHNRPCTDNDDIIDSHVKAA